jgi:hypothetical protein
VLTAAVCCVVLLALGAAEQALTALSAAGGWSGSDLPG